MPTNIHMDRQAHGQTDTRAGRKTDRQRQTAENRLDKQADGG